MGPVLCRTCRFALAAPVGLPLASDVVAAVQQGKFHIFSVSTIDEGIELLTGVPAGEPGPDGRFPKDSINGRVEAKLRSFALARHEFLTKTENSGSY